MAKFTPRAQTEQNDDGLKEKMIAAAETLPPLPAAPNSLRMSASAVDALANTRVPSSEMTLA